MKTTKEKFDNVMRALTEVGYEGLTKDEQEICDAFDNGALTILIDNRTAIAKARCET